MEAILYICHGSRVREASEQAVSFIYQVMEKVKAPIQEIGFLELSEPTIAESFERCVKKGATTIIAIPILLLTAAHAKEDIPKELAKLQLTFPHVKVKFGKPIGVHEKMIDLLLDVIAETNIPLKDDVTVLLVGRGSGDPDVKRDLTIIGNLLEKRSVIKRVEVCFLTAAEPSFQQGLEWAKESESRQVFVIPYLFFTGILMRKIEKSLKAISEDHAPAFILCSYLGYRPIIEEIIHEQIMELRSLEPK
jgi:sirohydrochlorin ferrochelatase